MFLRWGHNITFLRYSAWQLLHLIIKWIYFFILSTDTLCSFMWAVPINFCRSNALHTQTYKGCHIKGQWKTLGRRLGIVMTFQTQKLFLIWNILIKCVFGPASSFAVSTANNLLAQLWLLPSFSSFLPSTHTDIHYHLISDSWTQSSNSASRLKRAAGCPGSRIADLAAMSPMSLPSVPSITQVMQPPFFSIRAHYVMEHKVCLSSCCYCPGS